MRISDWSSDVCSSDLSVVRSFDRDPYGRFIDGTAVFDQRAGILYTIIGGGAKDRLVAYTWPLPGQTEGFDSRLVAEWPKTGLKAWGLAQKDLHREVYGRSVAVRVNLGVVWFI